MIRPCLLAAIASIAAGAEVARRDLQLAVETCDPGFSYRIRSPLGSLDGDDAFDRDTAVRAGVRWAWARPGAALAPLLGLDLRHEEAPLADGTGLRADGLAASAGATWGASATCALDIEVHAGWSQASLDFDTADGSGLSGDGSQTIAGIRARALWTPVPRWSAGVEVGWAQRSLSISADHQREVDLDSAGWTAGLVLCWRPSARPAGLE